jgi:hypothetical protein
VDQARQEAVLRTAGMLAGAAPGSVKTLVDLQQDVSVPTSVRRGAARDMLEMAVKDEQRAQEAHDLGPGEWYTHRLPPPLWKGPGVSTGETPPGFRSPREWLGKLTC